MINTPRGYVAQRGVVNRFKLHQNLHDSQFAQTMGIEDNECITPITPFQKRIMYKVIEFDDLIDSSNISIQDMIQIGTMIKENYNKYDAFMILHGTDTMAYSASMLSFMMENLNKPVIFTGSQIPILELKNDAIDNFLGSLLVAGQY